MEETRRELQEMFQQWSPRLEPSHSLSVAAESACKADAISCQQCKMCVALDQAVNLVQCFTQQTAQNLKREIREALSSKGTRLETQVQAAAQPGQSAHIDRDSAQIVDDGRQLRGTEQAPASSQQVQHDGAEGHSQSSLRTTVCMYGRKSRPSCSSQRWCPKQRRVMSAELVSGCHSAHCACRARFLSIRTAWIAKLRGWSAAIQRRSKPTPHCQ